MNPWSDYMRQMGLGAGPTALDPNPEAYAPQSDTGGAYIPDLGLSSGAPYVSGNDAALPGAYIPDLPRPQKMAVGTQEQPKGGAQISRAQQNSRAKYASKTGSVADYIRQAAISRGIDPNVALAIAQNEGGLDDNDVAREGKFPTGKSYWAYQLHYGGAGTPYASYGTTAGMGNDFTERTGYQPGDPNAWRAAVDFALDHARKKGWSAWYGRGPAGIGEWDGIPR